MSRPATLPPQPEHPEVVGGAAGTARSLDLLEGIGTPPVFADPRAGVACPRWPESLWLLNITTGELIQGRCKATNLCRYCQKYFVRETVEMLCLDALEYAPSLWAVLTAREHLTRDQCRGLLRHMRRSLERRWPAIEWFVQVEFQRRGALHLNLLLKGVPLQDLETFRERLVGLWCARVDALPVGQWCEPIEDGIGSIRYIAKMLAHGLKAEQAPPLGWKGHRTSQTRGYLVRPAGAMRQEARRSLRIKGAVHHEGLDIAAAAAAVDARSLLDEWRMVAR